jgi:dihydrofolate synthase/folylpolyglutamate synthase
MPQKLHNRSNDPALEKRLEDLLNRLYGFHSKEIDLSLGRVERFLSQLGDPHLKLPPVIHVAGTNGKGSTIATLRSLLENTGVKVHVYTSPHLVHPTERIRLAGEPITTQDLIDVLEECLRINQDQPITFFEIFTCAAFLIMSRVGADYVLLETGMGGRLDTTNVVPNPLLTIITTISKDHAEFLGSTLDQIASEKAGIMKADVPCVIGYQTDAAQAAQVQKVFQEKSTGLSPQSPLFRYGSEWDIRADQDENMKRITFTWHGESIGVSHPNLLGTHQIYNMGAALAAFRIITDKSPNQNFDNQILSSESQNNPLLTVFWPGRLQRLKNEPICKMAQVTQEIWVDGGHNDSAGYFLAEQMKQWKQENNRPIHLIVAMVNRKNPSEFLTPLIPDTNSLTVTEILDEPQSYTKEKLYDLCKPLGFKNLYMAGSVEQAIQNISDPNARILITGSLYLMGTILR